MKRILSLLLCLLVAAGCCTAAFAAGSVSYDGDADTFVFAPGTDESPSNLFEGFQKVMPGDYLMDQVVIKNDTDSGIKITVYLRSTGALTDEEFLSQLQLTVQQADQSVLFDAPANESAQLTDWVELGTIYPGGDITLDLTLAVPITMGPEFKNKAGAIDWEFKVEEFPVESPDTGDTAPLLLYTAMAVSSAALLVVVLLKKRSAAK